MNKKRLSVVMAGAMLATSVAPVLAAETEAKEVAKSGLTIYANTIKEKMEANKIDAEKHETIYGDASGATNFVSAEVSGIAVNDFGTGKSIYGVRKNGKTIDYTITSALSTIKTANPGDKIEIVKYETTDFHGLLIPGSEIKTLGTNDSDKYTEADFDGKFDTLKAELEANDYIKSVEVAEDKKSATVTLNSLDENNKNKTLTIAVGEAKLDLELPMSGDKLLTEESVSVNTDNIQKCDGFMRVQKWDLSDAFTNPEKVVETINVVADVDPSVEKVDVKDLYDGTILTSKGTEILNDIKNDKVANNNTSKYVKLSNQIDSTTIPGVNSFEVKYFVKGDTTNPVKTIKVSSTKSDDTTTLFKLLGSTPYRVGVVGGSNRYATAVSVAKEQGPAKLDKTNNKNVVLVNGDALVDGLATAPLAAVINGNTKAAAPILLSKSTSLPKETKDYLNEITSELSMKDRKEITVTLVGGESVLNDSLVEELKGMGFKVDRLGGNNREATSLEVAEAIGTTNTAFVVGANGEADAMSISAVAASDLDNKTTGKQVTPIIVSKAGGISKDALKFLSKQNGDAFIIGGESVVSKEDEEKINEAKSEYDYSEAVRIAGANRAETNAKIINTYYADASTGLGLANGVVLAKDGSNDKGELVDALTAANLGAPIVLANSKVSEGQLNAILKANTKASSAATGKVRQVGNGLDSSVIKSVAKALNLRNEGK